MGRLSDELKSVGVAMEIAEQVLKATENKLYANSSVNVNVGLPYRYLIELYDTINGRYERYKSVHGISKRPLMNVAVACYNNDMGVRETIYVRITEYYKNDIRSESFDTNLLENHKHINNNE
jgi:hypothetical protein